jgi:hypothetical protein
MISITSIILSEFISPRIHSGSGLLPPWSKKFKIPST